MKKILTLFSALLLWSCEDVLEEKPKAVAVENFYNTPSEIEAALFAIYDPLRDPNCLGGLYPAQQESMPDYGNGRGSYTIVSDYVGLNPANNTRVGQIWDLCYLALRNANLVIQNAPKGKSVTEDQAKAFVAEAKFMRAFIYFTMVRNWGGVPIRTESNLTEMNAPRSPAEEVYQLILEDLQEAEQNLPDNVRQAGRPSKWAAKTLLADVLLNRQQWTQARDKASEVINAKKYSLIAVTTPEDFLKLFGPDVSNAAPEEIFSLKFSRLNNEGFNFVMFAHHPGSKLHGAGGYYAHYSDTVANSFIKTWDKKDLRRSFNLYSYDIGLGKNSVLYRKFRDPAATSANGAANDYPFYRYADLLLIHAEAASRANGAPAAEALESLNQVHRRAYGKDPAKADADVDFKLADYDGTSFLDLVLQERGYETMYEGKRWLDLKRVGKAKERIKKIKGKDVADKHLLWPIPNSELNFNGALDPVRDQNPGY